MNDSHAEEDEENTYWDFEYFLFTAAVDENGVNPPHRGAMQ